MKKTLFLLLALIASVSVNAQTTVRVMSVLEGETELAEYVLKPNVKVVFKDVPTKGSTTRTGNVSVNWVQLWAGGPKFAEYNIGAANNKSTDVGWYLGWGGSANMSITDYNNGTKNLTGNTDTATKLWGSNWRLPTSDELANLHHPEVCKIEVVTENNVKGYRITGLTEGFTENSIFLPLAGYNNNGAISIKGDAGFYWSSEVGEDGANATCLRFIGGKEYVGLAYRYNGLSVRAVLK